jgi:hypothetical protein
LAGGSDIIAVVITPEVVPTGLVGILGVILIVVLIVWLLRGAGYVGGF